MLDLNGKRAQPCWHENDVHFFYKKGMREMVNPAYPVLPQVHHHLQTASKDEHAALLSSSFAIIWKETQNAMAATTPRNIIIILRPTELLEAWWFPSLLSFLASEELLARPSRTQSFHKPPIRTIREDGKTYPAFLYEIKIN